MRITLTENDYPPTDRQLKLIADMEETLDIVFDGTTQEEASDFIQEWMDEFKWYKFNNSENWDALRND